MILWSELLLQIYGWRMFYASTCQAQCLWWQKWNYNVLCFLIKEEYRAAPSVLSYGDPAMVAGVAALVAMAEPL